MSAASARSGGRRFGLVLFAIYCVAYAAFVGVAAFGTFSGGEARGGLAAPAVGGVPWGVVAGFLLIAGAFVLALLYATLAPAPEEHGGGAETSPRPGAADHAANHASRARIATRRSADR